MNWNDYVVQRSWPVLRYNHDVYFGGGGAGEKKKFFGGGGGGG